MLLKLIVFKLIRILHCQVSKIEKDVVSIISATFGQTWCGMNIIRNVCDQNWPNLELVLAETNIEPSFLYLVGVTKIKYSSVLRREGIKVRPSFAYVGTISHCVAVGKEISLKYFFFNATNFENVKALRSGGRDDESKRPKIGLLRNFLCSQADGKVFINFDNDDIYGPDYVAKIMSVYNFSAGMITVLEAAIATVLPCGNISFALTHASRTISKARIILANNASSRECTITEKGQRRGNVLAHEKRICVVDDTEYHIALSRHGWEQCHYSNRGMSEANQLSSCMQRKRWIRREVTFLEPNLISRIGSLIPTVILPKDYFLLSPNAQKAEKLLMPWLHYGLLNLIKFKSGLSTTSQVFLFRGNNLSPLFSKLQDMDMCEWRDHLIAQAAAYHTIHNVLSNHLQHHNSTIINDQSNFFLHEHYNSMCHLFPRGKIQGYRRRPGKLLLFHDHLNNKSKTLFHLTPQQCLDQCSQSSLCTHADIRLNQCTLFYFSPDDTTRPRCQQAPWRIFHVESYEKEKPDGTLLHPACSKF